MEDLTTDQRSNIKELSNEAKQLKVDDKSQKHVWRVRGSSKNGFFLKKIKKGHQTDQI